MRLAAPHVIISALILAAGLLLLPPVASTQTDTGEDEVSEDTIVLDTAPDGIVFSEIILLEGQVYAVDTLGNEWRYDFNNDVFVERVGLADGGDIRERPMPQDDLPIQERATEKREIRPGERSVLIGYDEYVDGDIIAVGRITVKGWVKGSVTSMQKRVLITETGRVDGDVEAPNVIVKSGGVVLGEIREESTIPDTPGAPADGIAVIIVFTVLLMFFGFIVNAVMPTQIDRFVGCQVSHPVKCYLVGFLFWLLMPLILTLCVITIVGIILVPFVPMIYAAAAVLGIVAFAGLVGRVVLKRTTGSMRGLQISNLAGLFVIFLAWMITALLLTADSAGLRGLGIAALVLAILGTSFPVMTGVGSALLTRFGARDYVSWKDRRPADKTPPAPAPPPLHEPPPIITPGPVPPPHRQSRGDSSSQQS